MLFVHLPIVCLALTSTWCEIAGKANDCWSFAADFRVYNLILDNTLPMPSRESSPARNSTFFNITDIFPAYIEINKLSIHKQHGSFKETSTNPISFIIWNFIWAKYIVVPLCGKKYGTIFETKVLLRVQHFYLCFHPVDQRGVTH